MSKMLTLLAVGLLAGCSQGSSAGTQLSSTPGFARYPLYKVFDRIKKEVGLFNDDDQKTRARWADYLRSLDAFDGCSKNLPLKFEITKVKMTFQVIRTGTTTFASGAKIPIPLVLSSIDPKLNFSHTNADSQEMTYYYYPGDTAYVDSTFDRANAIILNDLDALRDGIIAAGKQSPCFKNTPPESKDENSLTFGVTVVNDTTGGLGVEFLPAALSLGAGYELKSTSGNTIIVTFKPVNG